MSADIFIDTNIFLYAISDHPSEKLKSRVARKILQNENWCWSVQVAAEFFVNAISKKRKNSLTPADATTFIETWMNFPTSSLFPSTILVAIGFQERYKISYWDGAIIAASKQMNCKTIYSEDLNHRQKYDGIEVINPFK